MGSLHYLAEIPDPALAHSVPLDNPLHGPPPARFEDGEVLVVQYQTSPDAIRWPLPSGG